MQDESPHRLASHLEERFEALETQFHHAYWDSQIDVNPETERRRAELELELRRLKGDPDALAAVEHALEEEVHDGVLKRQLEVVRLSLLGNQMSPELRAEIVSLSSAIESDFAAFRPEIDGRRMSDNEIDEVLRESSDNDTRRRVWEGSKEVGRVVADRVVELARARNQVAREQGFADYYQMGLQLQEISEEWLVTTLDELERSTTDPFARWKAELDASLMQRFDVGELMPWHYSDPFFQTLPQDGRVTLDDKFPETNAGELARETFGRWGVDISHVLDASDLYPRERKSQHAFCLSVDRAKDVRILANVVPGERWVGVMLHESGHAAYDVSINPRLPYLLRRPAHIFVTEAIAIMSGRLLRDPDWLVTVAGFHRSGVEVIAAAMARANALQSLVFARWGLVMAHFERALYADPEADLNAAWWELVERFQLIARPPDRDAPDWAAKIHIATAPIYYHNYLLGEMLASQLRTAIERECGGFVANPEAGRWLVERVFSHGALLRWDALVESASGRPFSSSDFVRELTTPYV